MRYEDWEFHPSRLPAGTTEKAKAIKELEHRFIQELLQNQAVTEYLAPYDPKWAEKFLVDYAVAKMNAVNYSSYHIANAREDRELRYREHTEQVFDAILQKKLFNLQCLWRANQVTLPGVDVCWDFHHLERNIRSCAFIEPVTEEEMEVMRRFLQSDNYDIGTRSWLSSWQDYRDIKEQNENGDYYLQPEWYEFYDGHMGTGALMELPDLREEKEHYYLDLAWEEKNRIRDEQEKIAPTPPYVAPPPAIHCSAEERVKFSKAVDDELFQQIFAQQLAEQQERENESVPGAREAEELIMLQLGKVKNPPPVRGGLSWPEAIMRCWQDYLNGVIAEDLDLVYDEYKFYLETGIVPEAGDDTYRKKGAGFREDILRGRELAGEPRDFNF